MAEELSQGEAVIFRDIAAYDDDYDPGIESFNLHIRRSGDYLDSQGGYYSEQYHSTHAELNDEWPYLNQLGTLTGKLYVVDDTDMIDTTSGTWSAMQSDESGTFFMVEDVELVSQGILDVSPHLEPEQREDGTITSPVQFAYGFTVSGSEDDEPMFYAHPEDILKVKYDLPTFEAIDTKLHLRWPKQMRIIDRTIDAAGKDPNKKIMLLNVIMNKVEHACIDSDEFSKWLARYLHSEMDFDTRWAYEVEIEGDAHYLDDEKGFVPINFKKGSNMKLLYAGFDIVTDHTYPPKATASILFDTPSSINEDDGFDKQLLLPISSISSVASMRPHVSISDIINGVTNDHSERSSPSAIEMTLLPEVSFDQHRQIAQYKRLEQLEGLIKNWIRLASRMRITRYRTHEQADETSRSLIQMFAQEIDELHLEQDDMISVSGPGILKANANLTVGEGKFHVDIKQGMPVSPPPRATDIVGYYGALLAEVEQYEDADGQFWQIAPAMAIITYDEEQVVVGGTYPFVATSLKSAATARIDSIVEYTLPQLTRMRKRNESLTTLAISHGKTRELHAVRQLDIAFMQTDPHTWNDMGRNLKRVRDISSSILFSDDNELLEALKQQLIDRKVQLEGETWLGKSLSTEHISVGTVFDVLKMMMPNGDMDVVAAVASNLTSGKGDDPTPSQLVSLTKLKRLRF
jgi:hypothetical protein